MNEYSIDSALKCIIHTYILFAKKKHIELAEKVEEYINTISQLDIYIYSNVSRSLPLEN